MSRGYQQVGGIGTSGDAVIAREVESRSFYGADDRLRMFQTYEVRRTEWSNYVNAGVWEEYRYDALGRRVMVRTRTDAGLCDVDPWTCTASVTRFVWAGDNLLWELKQADGTMAAAAGGNVSYFHAGGIDRPLVITKDGQSIIPHQNWRGQFARGTYPNGYRSDCTQGATTGCTPIQWPGERTSARHELEKDPSIQNWYGGLVDGMRDASGQMYMRNRYYDPATGQFTQTDPIGLAGGLNAYGFAAGDPVSYSDPYGLCILPKAICEALARAGDEAVSYWAGRAASADSPAEQYVATGMGLLAALCTTDTCEHTDRTLRGDLVGGARGALQELRGGVVGHAADGPSNPNQMNQEVRAGAAPSTIDPGSCDMRRYEANPDAPCAVGEIRTSRSA